MLQIFRLLVNGEDSLAWVSLLLLNGGIGHSFFDHIVDRARRNGCQFGKALLDAFRDNFSGAPARPANLAKQLIQDILTWSGTNQPPTDTPAEGWGQWILEKSGAGPVPSPTEDFKNILHLIDKIADTEWDLSRYLSQITPLGQDIASATSSGVRIMTMTSSKGLTARATIIAGLEEGIIPRLDADRSEERRLLYVAMTRSKEFLYCTWARRRRGPTARAGVPRVSERRRHSSFLDGGSIASRDGNQFISEHW